MAGCFGRDHDDIKISTRYDFVEVNREAVRECQRCILLDVRFYLIVVQFSLKFILAHPAVNCVLTETANPKHVVDNLNAGFGRLPDEKTRLRMVDVMRDLANR